MPDDGGRQYERTAIAWLRTALAVTAVALLILRESDPGAERWVVGICIAGALVAAMSAVVKRTQLLHQRQPAATCDRGTAVALTGALMAMQSAALVLLF